MADITVKEKILQLVREQLPVGVVSQANDSLTLWIEDAADHINERRRRTTAKEIVLTLVEGTQVYDLPEDCMRVEEVLLTGIRMNEVEPAIRGFPLEENMGMAGQLPTGQRIDASTERIQRQEAMRATQEVSWRMVDQTLVLDFAVVDDTTARLLYLAIDRSVENLPRRYYDPIITYCKAKALEIFITQAVTSGDHVGDRLVAFNVTAIRQQRKDLEDAWMKFLGGVMPESD